MSPTKKIPLKTWAAQHYDPPPSPYILRQWRQRGEIFPPPEDVAPFYVQATAVRMTGNTRPTVVDRIRAAA